MFIGEAGEGFAEEFSCNDGLDAIESADGEVFKADLAIVVGLGVFEGIPEHVHLDALQGLMPIDFVRIGLGGWIIR